MAQVFRPRYYVDPVTGKRVNAGSPGAVSKKSPTWWIRYWLPSGKRELVKGYHDRKATEAYAAELERKAQRADAGMIDPTDEHAKRPLAEHAEDFRRGLRAKGNTDEYVAKLHFRLTAVLDGCRFVRLADIQASAVVEFIGGLRRIDQSGKSKNVKTANDYLAAVKGFTRWLWRDKRIAVDPLAGLSKLSNGDTDLRHARRDFSPDELRGLLGTAAGSAESFLGLTGTDRRFLYLTACATGFRVSELASVTPESFDLDGNTPTATVQAACTKNRREAVQPLPLDVARLLRDYLAGKPAGAVVWPGNWIVRGAAMIRRDLAAARHAWLENSTDARQRAEREQSDFLTYRDGEGRVADFHALRHTFITMVGKADVSAREHMDLARHSSYAMTARYSHSRFYDLAAAVQALPIPSTGLQAEVLSATGTDGHAMTENGPNPLGPCLGPRSDKTGEKLRQDETEVRISGKQKSPEKQAFAVISGDSDDYCTEYPQGDSNPCLSLERAMS
jgi:integrase/recombinase XerC